MSTEIEYRNGDAWLMLPGKPIRCEPGWLLHGGTTVGFIAEQGHAMEVVGDHVVFVDTETGARFSYLRSEVVVERIDAHTLVQFSLRRVAAPRCPTCGQERP